MHDNHLTYIIYNWHDNPEFKMKLGIEQVLNLCW